MAKFVGEFLKWIINQFTSNFWYMLLWTIGVYLTGSFTGILIPGYNRLIVKVGAKAYPSLFGIGE